MKKELTSVEIKYLVEELQSLVGSRIDKPYHHEREVFFRITLDIGKKVLRINLPFILLTEQKPVAPEKITSLSSILRKYIQGGKIVSISQLTSERVIKIVVARKDASYNLYVELFGTGNVILTDEHNHILMPLEKQEWKDRRIETGKEYVLPVVKIDTFKLSEGEFKDILLSSKESIVKTLALNLSLGGSYAEEVCSEAKIDKSATKISDKDIKKLYSALQKIINHKVDARIVYADSEVVDIVPFELFKYHNLKQTKFESYNSALDSELSKDVEAQPTVNVEKKYAEKIDKIKNIVKIQQDSLAKNEVQVGELQKKGELIYEKYAELEKLVGEIKAFKEKFGWKNIQQKFSQIRKVSEKDGEIVVEV